MDILLAKVGFCYFQSPPPGVALVPQKNPCVHYHNPSLPSGVLLQVHDCAPSALLTSVQVTQQAMNYAIRSGISITSSYAMGQYNRLVKTVDSSTSEKQQLADLQMRLESKIRIISPAIDMIELISARGNTSLESAVALTKSLRWDIQSLGVRLAKAVGEEELQRKGSSRAKSSEQNLLELKLIISDIKKLMTRIEDAVPLINLAITTSGVNLSNSLPQSVSPSRLLQASTFLTAGDSQYCTSSTHAAQIGPLFTLSMYMLFNGHSHRLHEDNLRETTWKEVIHKARVKLMRVPIDYVSDFPSLAARLNDHSHPSSPPSIHPSPHLPAAEGRVHEYAYQLLIIEDLDDDRVHTFDEEDLQPGPFEDVPLAGIREIIPIHEISKIFYADTGKILNIGSDGETNNPILLLKRDVNAVPPRRMMERQHLEEEFYDDEEEEEQEEEEDPSTTTNDALTLAPDDEQDEIDAQLHRESSRAPEEQTPSSQPPPSEQHWRLPPNLDPEWVAFEVYIEDPSSSDSDDAEEIETQTPPTRPAPASSPPSTTNLASHLSALHIASPLSRTPTTTPPPPSATPPKTHLIRTPHHRPHPSPHPTPSQPPPIPQIRTSLSLLEMLIRLTALQQFQQQPHLSIPDELLTFFLHDSATVGAGGDAERRRLVRRHAAERLGFDPYDESPIKRRGEGYLETHHGTPDAGYDGYAEEDEGGYAEGTAVEDTTRSAMYADADPVTAPSSSSIQPHPLRSATPSRDSPRRHRGQGSYGQSLRHGGASLSPSPGRDFPLPSSEFMEGAGGSPSPLLRRAMMGGRRGRWRGEVEEGG
ncbi:Ran-binding-domain-containing protein [Saccharata proteae CBS 121410]|uniref:Ran-binding-domain-containing protein n=1 Tax=Saccharata proteae CBS 121410 TaxID=1314787 RepID=A0A9P4I0Q7_9PEZI|nr:Ran-binding-domain-containing protein [Saccharata proteae CBS 121410]